MKKKESKCNHTNCHHHHHLIYDNLNNLQENVALCLMLLLLLLYLCLEMMMMMIQRANYYYKYQLETRFKYSNNSQHKQQLKLKLKLKLAWIIVITVHNLFTLILSYFIFSFRFVSIVGQVTLDSLINRSDNSFSLLLLLLLNDVEIENHRFSHLSLLDFID